MGREPLTENEVTRQYRALAAECATLPDDLCAEIERQHFMGTAPSRWRIAVFRGDTHLFDVAGDIDEIKPRLRRELERMDGS